MGRPRKSPEEVSAAARENALRRHHPERYEGGETGFSPPLPGNGDLPGSCSYDDVVCRPVTYQDAVQREKAIAAELENEELREAAAVRRGTLCSREQAQKALGALMEAQGDELGRFVEFAGTLVPPEAGTAARSKAQAFVADMKRRIAERIREVSPGLVG